MHADDIGRQTFDIFEARAPDQRAIAEHPEVLVGVVETGIHISFPEMAALGRRMLAYQAAFWPATIWTAPAPGRRLCNL
jgi:hypothetical protein